LLRLLAQPRGRLLQITAVFLLLDSGVT
jgi:hypothetical protein